MPTTKLLRVGVLGLQVVQLLELLVLEEHALVRLAGGVGGCLLPLLAVKILFLYRVGLGLRRVPPSLLSHVRVLLRLHLLLLLLELHVRRLALGWMAPLVVPRMLLLRLLGLLQRQVLAQQVQRGRTVYENASVPCAVRLLDCGCARRTGEESRALLPGRPLAGRLLRLSAVVRVTLVDHGLLWVLVRIEVVILLCLMLRGVSLCAACIEQHG